MSDIFDLMEIDKIRLIKFHFDILPTVELKIGEHWLR